MRKIKDVHRRFARQLKRSMRQIHRAGEKLFIDFAGPTIPLTHGGRVHIFVAALGASSYTSACATPRETMTDWISSTVRALEARITARAVEILHRGQRVASHVRSNQRGGFTTVAEHMPAAHRAHMEWTPQRLMSWKNRLAPARSMGRYPLQFISKQVMWLNQFDFDF